MTYFHEMRVCVFVYNRSPSFSSDIHSRNTDYFPQNFVFTTRLRKFIIKSSLLPFFLSLFVWVFFLLNKNTDLDATNIFLSKISFRNTASMAGRDRSNCAWQKTRSLRKLCLISQWMGLTVKFLRGAIGSKFRSGYALLNREICESRDANWNGKER